MGLNPFLALGIGCLIVTAIVKYRERNIKKCFDRMEEITNEERIEFLVSHGMGHLRRISQVCLLLRHGRIEIFGAAVSLADSRGLAVLINQGESRLAVCTTIAPVKSVEYIASCTISDRTHTVPSVRAGPESMVIGESNIEHSNSRFAEFRVCCPWTISRSFVNPNTQNPE